MKRIAANQIDTKVYALLRHISIGDRPVLFRSVPLLRPPRAVRSSSSPCQSDENYHMGHGAKKQRHVPNGYVP